MEYILYAVIIFLLCAIAWSIHLKNLNLPPVTREISKSSVRKGKMLSALQIVGISKFGYYGPFRIPIFGNGIQFLLHDPREPWKALDKMSKKYGDCFNIAAGTLDIIILTSYESMQEVLVLDEWSGKFTNFLLKDRIRGSEKLKDDQVGLIFVRDPVIWKEMRKFSQKTLREFGFGKRLSMQSVIESEMEETIKFYKKVADSKEILTIQNNFMLSSVNVLWTMLTGVRYEHDNPRLQKLANITFEISKSSSFFNLLCAFPRIYKLLTKILPGPVGESERKKINQSFSDFAQAHVQERINEACYITEPENYIDVFLQKIMLTASDNNSMYTEVQLMTMIQEFWVVGSLTTNATLSYGLLFLVLNPEVQKKVQEEIDEWIPTKSIPTIEDIEKMPYTQAVIMEIHRFASVVPIPIPRVMNKTTTYRGWTIRKDSLVISNHYSVMMDKDYWGDPENFRPERFISPAGEFVPDKRVVHFGFGKRYCIGVTLVNSVIPIHLTTLLQKFKFSLVPGEKKPSTKPHVGLSLTPYPFNVLVTQRK